MQLWAGNQPLGVVASMLQKGIRRGNLKMSCWAGITLYLYGYHNYAWKRLLIISAEDIHGPITQEVLALRQAFRLVNNDKKERGGGGVIICKAIILLCRQVKGRTADHAAVLLPEYVEAERAAKWAASVSDMEAPDFVYDCHTQKGRSSGKTRQDFFREELAALEPAAQGELDFLVNQGTQRNQ